MRADELTEGDRFRYVGLFGDIDVVATVLADPYVNGKGEVTFPARWDEPVGDGGDLYDCFFVEPGREVEVRP